MHVINKYCVTMIQKPDGLINMHAHSKNSPVKIVFSTKAATQTEKVVSDLLNAVEMARFSREICNKIKNKHRKKR